MKFHDRSSEWGQLILAGPQAAGIIEKLTASGEGGCAPAGDDLSRQFRRLLERPAAHGPPVSTSRGFTSFHLAGDAADMDPLWQALRESGAAACGIRALEIVRIEEGFPVIGLDITDKNLPQEVGRNEKAISFTKGCYLGQEIVARIDSRGAVSKVLCGFAFNRPTCRLAGGTN